MAVRFALRVAGQLKYIHAVGAAFLSREGEFRFGR